MADFSCVYKEFSSVGGAVRAALQQERLTSPPEYQCVMLNCDTQRGDSGAEED